MEYFQSPGPMDFTSTNLSEEWTWWKQKFELFLQAAGKSKEADGRKIAILLHCIGDEGIKIYNTFKLEQDKAKYDEVIECFSGHFSPKKNLVYERYKFLSCRQTPVQSFDKYLTELKRLASSCEYADESNMIRDVFVMGTTDDLLKEKLLNIENLTLESMQKAIQTYEANRQHLSDMTGKNVHSNIDINKLSSKSNNSKIYSRNFSNTSNNRHRTNYVQNHYQYHTKNQVQGQSNRKFSSQQFNNNTREICRNCGEIHRNKCPALGIVCHHCKKLNHYAKMCRSRRLIKSVTVDNNLENNNNNFRHSQDNYNSRHSEDKFFIGILGCSNNSTVWTIDVMINNKKISCQLDTGAEANVMSINTFKSLEIDKSVSLEKCFSSVTSFSGDKVPVIGRCSLNCLYSSGQQSKTEFIVTSINCPTVLGLLECTKLNLIKRVFCIDGPSVSYDKLFNEYDDLFTGVGCLDTTCHLTLKENAFPVVDPPRKIPFKLFDRLKLELKRMEDLGVVKKVTKPTEWVNSLVLVEKKNKSLRVCLDPRNLNKVLIRSRYPLPDIDYMKTKLSGAKYFSVLDASSGFWMIPLDPYSADLCTFNTPFGRYQFLRLPYGLSVAPEIFHRTMSELFHDLDVITYIDDLLIWGKTREEHDQKLIAVLERARKANLKLNKDKCKFGLTEIQYFGHNFSATGISPDLSKVRAITEMPSPKSVKDLQRFLGLVNYFGPFIKNLAEETVPLRALLRKTSVWMWSESHETTFKKLKSILASPLSLAYFEPSKGITLSVDASQFAVGAVLMQNKRPIAFASKTLTPSQQRYAQIEKELYAIVFGCQKFHQYVYGQTVTVETDHKPLVTLFKKPLSEIPCRLQRMMLTLQTYSLNATYVPGKQLQIADALSRAPLPDQEITEVDSDIEIHVGLLRSSLAISDKRLNEIRRLTIDDNQLQLLKRYHYEGWPDHKHLVPDLIKPFWNMRQDIHEVDNLLFKNQSLIIPEKLRMTILQIIHEGHSGIERCKQRARGLVYWPGIANHIENMAESCSICLKHRSANAREPLITLPLPELPWEVLGADLFEFEKTQYLLIVDYFSKYVEIAKLPTTRTSSVIIHCKSIFARHGIPRLLITDNGPQFASAEFTEFMSEWDIEHRTSSPHYPQGNGLAERSVRTIKNILKKCKDSNSDPYIALLNYRASCKRFSYSPAQLLMSRNLRTRLPVTNEYLVPNLVNYKKYKGEVDQYQLKTKQYYNTKSKPLPDIDSGRRVYYKQYPNSTWSPGIIVSKARQPRSYIVADSYGHQYRRNRRHLIFTNVEDVIKNQEDSQKSENSLNSTNSPKHKCETVDSFTPMTLRSGKVLGGNT